MEWLLNNVYWWNYRSNYGMTELQKQSFCEFFKIFEKSYFYRTRPVAASGINKSY